MARWLKTCRSLQHYSGSIQCSIHFEMIRASRNSAKTNRNEPRVFSAKPKRCNVALPVRVWAGEKGKLDSVLPSRFAETVDSKRMDRLRCVYLKKIFARLCRGKVLETVTEGEQ